MAAVNFFVYKPEDEARLIAFETEVKREKNVDIREQLIKWEPLYPKNFHAPLSPFQNGMIVCCQTHKTKKIVGYVSIGFEDIYFQDFSTKTACLKDFKIAERFALTSMPDQLLAFAKEHAKKVGAERMLVLRNKQDFDLANTFRTAKFDTACQMKEYIYALSDRKAAKKIKKDLPSRIIEKDQALEYMKTYFGRCDLATEKLDSILSNECYKGTLVVEDDDHIVGASFWEYTSLATQRVERFVIPMRYYRHPVYKYLIYLFLLINILGFIYLEYMFFQKAPILAVPLLYVLYRILHVLFVQGSIKAFFKCFNPEGMRRVKLFGPFCINKKDGTKEVPKSEDKFGDMFNVLVKHAIRHAHEQDYYTLFFKCDSENVAVEKLGKPRNEINILQASLEEDIKYVKYGGNQQVNTKNIRLPSCTNFVFIDPRYT